MIHFPIRTNCFVYLFVYILQNHDNPVCSNQAIAHFRDGIIREDSDQALKRMKTYK